MSCSKLFKSFALLIWVFVAFSCTGEKQEGAGEIAERAAQVEKKFEGTLNSLNQNVTVQNPSGTADITVYSDSVAFSIIARNLSEGSHLVHLHGFTEPGKEAQCPTITDDGNQNGIIEVEEIKEPSGKTLIPWNQDPVELEFTDETYPTAMAEGSLEYTKTVHLKELEQAVKDEYQLDTLDFERLVLFVHGISEKTGKLENSQSLVTNKKTLPIACVEF